MAAKIEHSGMPDNAIARRSKQQAVLMNFKFINLTQEIALSKVS